MRKGRVELIWDGKYDEQGRLRPVERVALPFQTIEVINEPREKTLLSMMRREETGWRNKLIWGDNKYVLASLLEEFAGKIDLIYIDPPFATGADFSINIKLGDLEWTKKASIIEEKAYRDTWGRGLDSYLQMMYERLVLMRELLADNGSIYVHLDWHVGHYVKLVMDEIFAKENFRNMLIWYYGGRGAKAIAGQFPRNYDMLLLYSKSESCTFNRIYSTVRVPYAEASKRGYRRDELGRWFKTAPRGDYTDASVEQLRKEGRIHETQSGNIRIKYFLKEENGYVLEEKLLGDVWDDIPDMMHAPIAERLDFPTQKPEALLERIIEASSNKGDLVADFFCGSGTTLAVAEKLNRRWIGCDLSRFAIQVTRKRLLDIPDCRPFEVLNLGKYERQYWQMNIINGQQKDERRAISEYIEFIVKLYQAQPIQGFAHLHGKKAGRVVHVGAVDAPVTFEEVKAALEECRANGFKALDVLGWEWEMGLNELVRNEAANIGVDLRLLVIPREVMDKRAVEAGDVHFYELAHLDLEVKQQGRAVTVALKNFIIPNPELIPPDVRDKIKQWSDYIDFWAIDWDYRDDTFRNQWQSFRTRKHPELETVSKHQYQEPGTYKILVKVIDIFGNDTTKLLEVTVP